MNDMTPPPKDEPRNFPAMLKAYGTEIARALPKHMNGDRMARIALTAFRTTPKLAECDPKSVFAAVIQSSQLGLEVGLMGEAHLVPFKDKCQLIPGYQGLMKLARNSGLIQDIYAHEVRENDKFQMTLGLERSLIHEPMMSNGFPAGDKERGEIVGFYAVAVFKDNTRTFQAMSRAQVDKIRDESKGYKAAKLYKKESLWDTDYLSMGLKTVIRRLCKFLPKSPELAQALALDSLHEHGKEQKLDTDQVIEGTWAPSDEDNDDEPKKPDKDALPAYPEEQFKKNLKGWLKQIADKKKTADDIVTMLASKYTLSDEQLSAITGEKDKPASTEALQELRQRAEAAAITDAEIAKHLGIDLKAMGNLTAGQVGKAIAFIADPAGAAS